MLPSFAVSFSPLLVFLEAIAGPSCVDSNKNDVNETASFLLSILRAIKLAEDAVDSCGTSVSAVTIIWSHLIILNVHKGYLSGVFAFSG